MTMITITYGGPQMRHNPGAAIAIERQVRDNARENRATRLAWISSGDQPAWVFEFTPRHKVYYLNQARLIVRDPNGTLVIYRRKGNAAWPPTVKTES